MSRAGVRVLGPAYVVYLAVVAYLVWTPDSSAPGSAVLHLTDLLVRVGLPATETRVEFLLNVVMLVPLSLLGAFLFRHWRAGEWVTAGFVLSLVIEAVQRFLLPSRDASARDVVANTLGALIGVCCAWAVREVLRRLRQ